MEIRVARKYRVGVKLGSGSFGEVYAGVNVETGEDIAMKLEPIKSRHPQLLDEAKVYRALKGGCEFLNASLHDNNVTFQMEFLK